MVVPFVGAEIGVEAQRHQAGKSNAGTDAAPATIAPRPGFSCDISISFGVNGPARAECRKRIATLEKGRPTSKSKIH